MARTFLMLTAAALVTGCSMTPIVTKQRMTLGEANIEGMECRWQTPPGSSIPKNYCAKPEYWARFDKRETDKSQAFYKDLHDNADNRILYRNQ